MNPTEHNIVIDEDRCIGCGECLDFCHVDAIELNDDKGVVEIVDLEICIECHMCERHCPEQAIKVYPEFEEAVKVMR